VALIFAFAYVPFSFHLSCSFLLAADGNNMLLFLFSLSCRRRLCFNWALAVSFPARETPLVSERRLGESRAVKRGREERSLSSRARIIWVGEVATNNCRELSEGRKESDLAKVTKVRDWKRREIASRGKHHLRLDSPPIARGLHKPGFFLRLYYNGVIVDYATVKMCPLNARCVSKKKGLTFCHGSWQFGTIDADATYSNFEAL
jgi:hypothetical protein